MKELNIPEEIKQKVIVTGYIEKKEELAQMYQGALLFVLPSIYEGFGLVVLEAMRSGTPVLCSHTSSLPEVGGDAAKYADPNDPEDFAEKIIDIINDSKLRRKMIKKGCQRARLFSWEKAAKETLSLYKEIQEIL